MNLEYHVLRMVKGNKFVQELKEQALLEIEAGFQKTPEEFIATLSKWLECLLAKEIYGLKFNLIKVNNQYMSDVASWPSCLVKLGKNEHLTMALNHGLIDLTDSVGHRFKKDVFQNESGLLDVSSWVGHAELNFNEWMVLETLPHFSIYKENWDETAQLLWLKSLFLEEVFQPYQEDVLFVKESGSGRLDSVLVRNKANLETTFNEFKEYDCSDSRFEDFWCTKSMGFSVNTYKTFKDLGWVSPAVVNSFQKEVEQFQGVMKKQWLRLELFVWYESFKLRTIAGEIQPTKRSPL